MAHGRPCTFQLSPISIHLFASTRRLKAFGDKNLLAVKVLTPHELLLVTARIALSSFYLCLEATLTGSLWLSVGTSVVGLATAMGFNRGKAA